MGKSRSRFKDFARAINSDKLHRPKFNKPVPAPNTRIDPSKEPERPWQGRVQAESEQKNLTLEMGASSSEKRSQRTPLAEVVSDCVSRWFRDTLNQAKAGDRAMQVTVGQMYASGYGVPRDAVKGLEWLQRASPARYSAWNIIDKQPGYNGSDSDSDQNKDSEN